MTENPFDGPRLTLQGARAHIRDLEAGVSAFLDSCYAVPRTETNPKTGETVIYFRVEQRLDPELRRFASSAVNELRHALDQAYNQATAYLGLPGNHDAYFPLAKSENDFLGVIKGKHNADPLELIAVLKAAKPYAGGDDLLYELGPLSRMKHIDPLNLDVDLPALYFDDLVKPPGITFRQGSGLARLTHLWDGKKQELEFIRAGKPPILELQDEAKLPLRVSFAGSKAAGGQPAPGFLNTVADTVDGIISAIEAATFGLKPL